jgi:hypothetical protein
MELLEGQFRNWMGENKRVLPSEAIEAPERRKISEPIWIEKTFSLGRLHLLEWVSIV